MTVDVLVRFELEPAYGYAVSANEMFRDLQTYLRLKEHDHTLQCNATKLKINSFITKVIDR